MVGPEGGMRPATLAGWPLSLSAPRAQCDRLVLDARERKTDQGVGVFG